MGQIVVMKRGSPTSPKGRVMQMTAGMPGPILRAARDILGHINAATISTGPQKTAALTNGRKILPGGGSRISLASSLMLLGFSTAGFEIHRNPIVETTNITRDNAND
jgi:hypothetical protein